MLRTHKHNSADYVDDVMRWEGRDNVMCVIIHM